MGFEGLSDAVGGFNLHPGLCTLWSGSPGGLVRYSFSPVNSRVYNFGWYGKCDRMRSRNALGRHQQHRFLEVHACPHCGTGDTRDAGLHERARLD